MKTLVRFFFATALLAVTATAMLAHNSASSQLVAFRSGAEVYMDGPVPWPGPDGKLVHHSASPQLIAFRDGAEIYMDGPVPWPTGDGPRPAPSTPQKPSMSIG